MKTESTSIVNAIRLALYATTNAVAVIQRKLSDATRLERRAPFSEPPTVRSEQGGSAEPLASDSPNESGLCRMSRNDVRLDLA